MRPAIRPPSFNTLDQNADGALTLDELIAGAPGGATDAKASKRAEALFKAMDQDGDGSVTSTEKDSFDSKMAAQRQSMQFMTQMMAGGQRPIDNNSLFDQTDTDGNGSVSLAELGDDAGAKAIGSDGLQKLFAMIDADGDGAISKTESSDFLDSVKSAVMDIVGGGGKPGAASGGIPDGMSLAQALNDDSDEDDEDKPFDLMSLAQNAYSSQDKSADLLSQLKAIFDSAA
jgi:Ca2+-binding EF-hand superfamily protein